MHSMDLSYDTITIENFIQTLYLPYTASMIGSSAKNTNICKSQTV